MRSDPLSLAARFRTASWLGWQIESNWADPFLFVVYSLLRPLATAMILAGMYWAVRGHGVDSRQFLAFYVGNAFHIYVIQVLVGMGWTVVEEREDFETLKYVFASPIGMFVYLAGRASVKLVLATVSVVLTLAVGWFAIGLRWDWSTVAWAPLLLSWALGLVATLYLGFFVAGIAMLLPRAAMNVNEGLSVALYLLCGVIFPIDLLPRLLQWVALLVPLTWWYEALRRFLLGHGASARLSHWSDGALLAALLVSTVVFSIAARWGYLRLEHRARQLGRLDQTTLF
jgi:ABC-2 type transport system permease protein